NTNRAPRQAARTAAASRISATTRSAPRPRRPRSSAPGSTTATTCAPLARTARATAEPINPAAPVMTTLLPRSTQATASPRPAVDPGREHDFTPVWVLVGDAAVGLPVIDLRHRVDARGRQPGHDALLGGRIGEVEHQLIKPGDRVPPARRADDLQMHGAAGQPEDRPVQAIAVLEGFQHRQADDVPVEDDRLLILGAPPHDTQRTHRKMLRPARTPVSWGTHASSAHFGGAAIAAAQRTLDVALVVQGGLLTGEVQVALALALD